MSTFSLNAIPAYALTLCMNIFKKNASMTLNKQRQIWRLLIFKKGLCDGEMAKSMLYLLNWEITTKESVNILIWQFLDATKIAVNITANSATDDEGNDAIMVDA